MPNLGNLSLYCQTNRKHYCQLFCVFVLHTGPLESVPDITDLLDKVAASANEKWKIVGLKFKISLQQLNSIDEKYKQAILCYAEVFQLWKNKGDPPFTWGTIIDVLKAPSVGEAQLATELQEWLRKQ